MPTRNRIWIELNALPESPAGACERSTFAAEQCVLANRMLDKIGNRKGEGFFYSNHERENCYCFGGDMGYETLPDRGGWFNLDYMGREQD